MPFNELLVDGILVGLMSLWLLGFTAIEGVRKLMDTKPEQLPVSVVEPVEQDVEAVN